MPQLLLMHSDLGWIEKRDIEILCYMTCWYSVEARKRQITDFDPQ